MRHSLMLIAVLGFALALLLVGCSSGTESNEYNTESEHGEQAAGSDESDRESEHGEQAEGSDGSDRESEDREHGEGSEAGDGDEESGVQYSLGDTFDQVRAGARLVLSYDSDANAFTGTVENTTNATLRRVRVEVHLSNGIELGPTTPVDLASGQVVEISLPASGQPFTSWSAHPEVG